MYSKLKNVRFMLNYFGVYAPLMLLILTFSPLTESYSVVMLLVIIIIMMLVSSIYSFVIVRKITDKLEKEKVSNDHNL